MITFHKVANTRTTHCFCSLWASFNYFLFPKWVLKKVLWKIYKGSLDKSCKSWKRSKRDWESNRNLQTFCLYNPSFRKKVCLFFSPIYFSYSSLKSFLISKFEKVFEAIWKNNKDYKETLRRYSFKKPTRQIGPSEQVSPISISDFEEDRHKDDLHQ
jgi:hypothetical protein